MDNRLLSQITDNLTQWSLPLELKVRDAILDGEIVHVGEDGAL
jgi:hypothetical protein